MFGGGANVSGVTFFDNTVPFAIGADNGISVDLLTGNVVLGNDVGDPLKPAQFLSDREIDTNGFFQSFVNAGSLSRINVDGQLTRWIDDIGSIEANAIFNAFQVFDNITGESTSLSAVSVVGVDPAGMMQYNLNTSNLIMNDTGAGIFTRIAPGAIRSGGTIQTADPGSGVGVWQLGTLQPGAAVLDATQSVEINIGGTIVKLGVIV